MTLRHRDIAPDHPGAYLAHFVCLNWGFQKRLSRVIAFARHIGISRQMLMNILAGKRGITPQMAVRLGRSLGNDPKFWLNLQQAHGGKTA